MAASAMPFFVSATTIDQVCGPRPWRRWEAAGSGNAAFLGSDATDELAAASDRAAVMRPGMLD